MQSTSDTECTSLSPGDTRSNSKSPQVSAFVLTSPLRFEATSSVVSPYKEFNKKELGGGSRFKSQGSIPCTHIGAQTIM